MPTLIIIDNVLEPGLAHGDVIETDDLCAALAARWNTFPTTARIYHQCVAQDHDVTPEDVEGIRRLQHLTGTVYVVVYPAGSGIYWGLVKLVVAGVLSIVANALMPKPSLPNQRNRNKLSSNGDLSARVNTERLGGRIPDIFGTEWSTPDLIAVPYSIFESSREVEICAMCIGRGSYTIHKVLEDTTPFSSLSGASLEIYAPNTSPNSGDDPYYTIGEAIDTPIVMAKRSNSVNGDELRAPNENTWKGHDDIKFVYPNQIYSKDESRSFTDKFDAGDPLTITYDGTITVSKAVPPPDTVDINLDGTYVIDTITPDTITLVDPHLVNPAWLLLETDGETEYLFYTDLLGDDVGPFLETDTERWTEYIILDDPALTKVYANFVAPNGLYKENNDDQYRRDVDVVLELTPIDSSDEPTGDPELFEGTVVGSSRDYRQRALTIMAEPTFTGRCRVRARRITKLDKDFDGVVQEAVHWRDLYAVAPISQTDFGDCTTLMTKQYATLSALALKERKLKILCTRNIPARIGTTSTFTSTLYPSDSAADILCAVCLDPYIGRRTIAELDVDSIYDAIDECETYFGTELATQWGGTFSDGNTSLEETLTAICSAVFCRAYRRGSHIKLELEQATDNSVLLFNHRNKIPHSEVRTYRFGTLEQYDGVEIEWQSPDDGAVMSYYIPTDRSAINPQPKIDALGVRNNVQAHFLAWRAYNKLRYRYLDAEFDATQEVDILALGDRVLVADNTRQDTQDGEIIAQDGLVLTTSQDCTFVEDKEYTIFLQLYDGTVESFGCVAGAAKNQVVIDSAPSLPLAVDDHLFAKTTYTIVADDDPRCTAFLVTEIEPQESMTSKVSVSNYDPRYYANDTDFINELVTED